MKDAGQEALETQDHKGAWKYIRAASFTSKKGADVLLDSNLINDYFAKVVSAAAPHPLIEPLGCDNTDSFHFEEISVELMEKMLSGVNISTAVGPDQIPGFLVKKLAGAMAPNITKILNTSFQSNCFPTSWKRANVCPV